MKVVICGGRDFDDDKIMLEGILKFVIEHGGIHQVISGAARGADKMGEAWAKSYNLPISSHPADWDTHGKSAGYRRNKEMIDIADACIAYWDGVSKGTKHTIDLAEKKGIPLLVVKY